MLGREKLTSVSDAQRLLLSRLESVTNGSETVSLTDALDRITAEEIISPEDLPSSDRSTMDGYAVISADTFGASQSLPAYLSVTGEVVMGIISEGVITRGTCMRIPTGGSIPKGADAVQMLEHTVAIDETMIEVVKDIGSGTNIIRKGDDIKIGQTAVPAGRKLRPQDLGLLAGLGITSVLVRKKIRVGIISTGDEIVDWNAPAPAGKVRNINSITLAASARRVDAEIIDYGIVPDTREHFFPTVEKAVRDNDLVMFSGGSSVGMKDLGEQAISRLGNPGILVHGVSLKPGKPVIIGLCGDTPVFGLPGHPVSALVCFSLFAEPAILKLSGRGDLDSAAPPPVTAQLQRNINSAAGRLDIVRVSLDRAGDVMRAFPVLGKSGAISSLSNAHGYFVIEEDTQGLEKGSPVEVYLYS